MAVKKAVWIRMAIYVPLLGFFGFQAIKRYRVAKNAEDNPAASPSGPQPTTRTVTLPDGQQVQVYEVTAEEAEKMLGPAANEGAPTPDQLPALTPPGESGTDKPSDAAEPAADTPTTDEPAEPEPGAEKTN